MGALDHAVRSGRALYAGISSYSPQRTREAATIARDLGTPLLIHQPSYSMLNRWIEDGLLDELETAGHGLHRLHRARPGAAHRPLPRRASPPTRGRPARAPRSPASTTTSWRGYAGCNEIAAARGQKLAQLALQWALRDPRVTSAVIGASSVRAARHQPRRARASRRSPTTSSHVIDRDAVESGVNLWATSAEVVYDQPDH